ncbi:MAG: alanine dehydrogenase [Thermacetogeniaceae bacterium]
MSKLVIGVPKEIKAQESRVGMTPAGVDALIRAGHQVIVEQGAGVGSGFADSQYTAVGAAILPAGADVWAKADLIIKVKEPLPSEYDYFKKGQVIYTYFHLAPELALTKALIDKQPIAVAYETVELDNGALPLLTPMSEVAGRMAVQVGATYLEKPHGGKGKLIGGVAGVAPAHVVIIGGGVVGTSALKRAIGAGARVTVLDRSLDRLRYLDDIFGNQVETLASNRLNIASAVKSADLLIGAVLVPGTLAPQLVTEEMVATMEEGSVIVDVAIDQGGCIETIDHSTTHQDPVYIKHGVVHYAVANMPGAVSHTSTLALTNATLPYALDLANKGWKQAIQEDPALAKGVNVVNGIVTFAAVAAAHGLPYVPLEEAVRA